MAITDHSFAAFGDESADDDDLPRTFRREKEARAREAQERAALERASAPSLPNGSEARYASIAPQLSARSDAQPMLDDMTYPASVRAFDVPFSQLVVFLLKAVVAGIPALILLTAILWTFGVILQAVFPEFIKMKILFSFPH